jgi:hypothetical protein
MKRVIAFAGPAGVGKSTAAVYLSQEDRLGKVIILSFAEPMRRMVSTILPLGMESFEQGKKTNPTLGLCGKTPRQMLETIGTEWGKNLVGENIWLDIVANQIMRGDADTYIIDDLRTDAEAIYLRDKLGAIIIHLSRQGVDYKRDHITSCPISEDLVTHFVTTKDRSDLRALRNLARPI